MIVKLTKIKSQKLFIINSTIGDVSTTNLQTLVTLVLYIVGFPAANKVIGNGFPLPQLSGVSLVNTTLTFGNNYLQVNTDFTYNQESLFQNVDIERIVKEATN